MESTTQEKLLCADNKCSVLSNIQSHESCTLDRSSVAGAITTSVDKQTSELAFPDGGWVAWTNVVGSVMVLFVAGINPAFGVFQDFYTRVFLPGNTPAQISWIGSVQLFLTAFLAPFSGIMFDKGYFKPLLLISSVLFLFSFFMLSLAKPHQFFQVFLFQGLGLGLSTGLMFIPSIANIAHYFKARRSLIIGMVMTGSSLGGIVIPIMLNNLFNKKSAGFAWGVRYLGFIFLALLLIANLVSKPRFPGRTYSSTKKSSKLLRKLLTDVPYMLAMAGLVFVFWGLFYPLFYLQLFAALHGLNVTLVFYSLAILNGASIFGQLISNLLADSYGPMNISLMGICCGCLMFAMFVAKTVGGLVTFAVLYGFISGGITSLGFPAITAFAEDVSEIGSRSGIAMLSQSIVLLIGGPINGRLLDAPNYSWHRAIIFNGVIVLSGSFLLFVSRTLLAKKRGMWRV